VGSVLLLFLVFCVVFFFSLRLVFLMLPVSLKCPFLIVPSVFSNVYIEYFLPLFLFMVCQYMRSFICVVSFLFMVCSSCSWNVLPIHGWHSHSLYFILFHCSNSYSLYVIPIHGSHSYSLYFIPIHCMSFIVCHSYSLYFIPIQCISFLFIVCHSYSLYFIPIHGSHSYSW
jgi:hypothetical protein